MSLPGSSSMGKKTFPKLERYIGPKIQNLSEKLLNENLIEEVRRTYIDKPDFPFHEWADALRNNQHYDFEKP